MRYASTVDYSVEDSPTGGSDSPALLEFAATVGAASVVIVPVPGEKRSLQVQGAVTGDAPFDLSSPSQAASLPADLIDETSALVVCLEGLVALDPFDLAVGLQNFSDLVAHRALVRVGYCERPNGAAPGILLPRATWLRLFERMGLSAIDMPANSPDLSQARVSQGPRGWPARYWASRDLFRDASDGGLILLERTASATVDGLLEFVDDLLDLAPVRARRAAMGPLLDRDVALNIHHVQDFFQVRPLLDVLPAGRVRALIRECAGSSALQRAIMRAWFERCGVECRLYRRIEDLDLSDLDGALMISASESTATPLHSLARQTVEAARFAGASTVLLQHGVWLEQFGVAPLAFGSDVIVAWGAEQARSFSKPTTFLGLPATWSTTIDRFEAYGGARLAETSEPGDGSLETRLGLNLSGFEQVVFVGTNLHWGRNTDCSHFQADLRKLARLRPNTLFLLKPHPSEQASTYDGLISRNVWVIDNLSSILCDTHTPRLLRGSDVLATSLSSVAIDGACAGIPVFQYETGNALSYEGLQARPLRALGQFIDAPDNKVAGKLKATYADASQPEFFKKFAALAQRLPVPDAASRKEALERLAILSRVETDWIAGSADELRLNDLELVHASGLFDPDWYRTQVTELSMDPLVHFLQEGTRRQLRPRPSFDTAWYLSQNEDARAASESALVHYLREGAAKGHDPHRLFDTALYLSRTQDLKGLTPLAHYLIHGEREDLAPTSFFDPAWYLRKYPDLGGLDSLLEHFITYGEAEGRQPHPGFDLTEYLRRNRDLAESGVGGLQHFIEHGAKEARPRSDIPGF